MPSLTGFVLLAGLHIGACGLIWWLNWPWWLCICANVFILGLMIYTIDRYIFAVTRYQLSFFFADHKGWVIQQGCSVLPVRRSFLLDCRALCARNDGLTGRIKQSRMIQEDENVCYRTVLRYAFCGKYLVILVFKNKLILPIFFDSLPPAEFRQLRKVLILLDYV